MRHRNPEKDFPSGLSKKILNCGLMKPYPADPTTRKVVEKITLNFFLRVIPTLKHYSGIGSGIPSGSIWKNLWHIDSGFLSGIYFDILSGIYFDIHSGVCSDILAGILLGIYSDILSGIFSGIHSGILSGIWSDML
jgi:hypothetical protein